ncbi:MAG: hypothetical protein RIM80_15705 [Alphaproteobacteria bacterium]
MHDIHALDVRGVPGCATATVAFKQAAAAQAGALGFEPAIVWTEHPIQNRTADELKALAAAAAPEILALIAAG